MWALSCSWSFIYSLTALCCTCSVTAVSGKLQNHTCDIRGSRSHVGPKDKFSFGVFTVPSNTLLAQATWNVLSAKTKVLLGKYRMDTCWCLILRFILPDCNPQQHGGPVCLSFHVLPGGVRCSNKPTENKVSILRKSPFSLALAYPRHFRNKSENPGATSWLCIFSFLHNHSRKAWDEALFPQSSWLSACCSYHYSASSFYTFS